VSLSGILSCLEGKSSLVARDMGTGKRIECSIQLSDREREILKKGGLLNYIKSEVRG
jgi:hypothetical protein